MDKNIYGTLFNVHEKTNDRLNAQLDLVEMGLRKNLALLWKQK